MSSDAKDESYWIGVRDALRMVDSFLRWSRRNPTIAKTLDEFLAEGLVAAAKRCESCLGRELGLKYGKEDPEKGMDESAFAEVAETAEVTAEAESATSLPEDAAIDEGALIDALGSEGFDDLSEHVSKVAEEIAEEGIAEPVSIESIEPDHAESPPSIEDLEFEAESGEFTSDFELAEPEPLVIDTDETDSASETEESIPEISPPPEEPLSFEVTPPTEDSEEEIFTPTKPEPPVPPVREIWSPYDEPAISEEERAIDEDDVESEEAADSAEAEAEKTEPPVKRAPPPPPPPETDETEEERQKRARRLFFGA